MHGKPSLPRFLNTIGFGLAAVKKFPIPGFHTAEIRTLQIELLLTRLPAYFVRRFKSDPRERTESPSTSPLSGFDPRSRSVSVILKPSARRLGVR